MAKFKEGDKIRAKKAIPRGGIPESAVLTISGMYDEDNTYAFCTEADMSVSYDTRWAWLKSEIDMFELVEDTTTTQKTPTPTPKFKVGDMVEFILGLETLVYSVCDNHLWKQQEETGNGIIFTKLGIDRVKFCKEAYGYDPVDHVDYYWPAYKLNDIDAASRCIELLQEKVEEYNTRLLKKYATPSLGDKCQEVLNLNIGGKDMVWTINRNTNINKITKTKMNLINKFKELTRSEPNKTFVKVGILNSDLDLTPQGTELFIKWMFDKHADEFKVVADQLVEEDK